MQLLDRYRNLKLETRLLALLGISVLLMTTVFLSGDWNLTAPVGFFLLFLVVFDLALKFTRQMSVLFVIAFQALAVGFISMAYALMLGGDAKLAGEAIVIGSMYSIGMSWIITWCVFKFSSGALWFKLLLGYLLFDFGVYLTLSMFGLDNINVYAVFGLGILFTALVSVPWTRSDTKAVDDFPRIIKTKESAEAVKTLIEKIENVKVVDSNQLSTDFIVIQGKKKYNVSVLGLTKPVILEKGTMAQGNHNIQPLVLQTALESKKGMIPVVVNASDKSNTFAELKTQYLGVRKTHSVFLMSPMRLSQILSGK